MKLSWYKQIPNSRPIILRFIDFIRTFSLFYSFYRKSQAVT